MVAILENGRHLKISLANRFFNIASTTKLLTAKALKYIEQVLAIFSKIEYSIYCIAAILKNVRNFEIFIWLTNVYKTASSEEHLTPKHCNRTGGCVVIAKYNISIYCMAAILKKMAAIWKFSGGYHILSKTFF